ncbi:MAG TPA: hypothetical protein PKZ65_02900 [Methanoregulaceae archaeon]|nr:hypothetical protein [Methanoregulaceae archaeon]
MPRELTEKDIAILKKLAPEFCGTDCSGSGHMFRSILPPVSNHFSEDGKDFAHRISRLSDEELQYIADMIVAGEESLGCLPEEDLDSVIGLVKDRLSPDLAKKILNTYAAGESCGFME